MTRKEAEAYRTKIETAAESQNDAEALESIELFKKWEAGMDVTAGQRYQHIGKLWRVVQTHTTQADWEPQNTPALWTEVSLDEWPDIPENIPSTAPWMSGDKGTWKGQHYICQLDNCVWNPEQLPSAWNLA